MHILVRPGTAGPHQFRLENGLVVGDGAQGLHQTSGHLGLAEPPRVIRILRTEHHPVFRANLRDHYGRIPVIVLPAEIHYRCADLLLRESGPLRDIGDAQIIGAGEQGGLDSALGFQFGSPPRSSGQGNPPGCRRSTRS